MPGNAGAPIPIQYDDPSDREPSATNPADSLMPNKPEPSKETPRDWKRTHLWELQPVRDVLVVLTVFGIVWLGYKLSVVTVPILLALLLAYLFEPFVRWLTKRNWFSRGGAALMIIGLAGVIIVVPVTFGAGFAVVKGAAFASDVATNIARVQRSVNKPDDERLKAAIPSGGWLALRNYIVELDEEAAAAAARSPADDKADESPRPGSSGDQESRRPSGDTADPSADRPDRARPSPGAPSGPPAEPDAQPKPDPDGPARADASEQPDATDEADEPARDDLDLIGSPLMFNPDDPPLSLQSTEQQARTLTRQAVDWLRANAEQIGTYLGRRALGTGAEALAAAVGLVTSIGFLGFTGFLTAFFFYAFCTGWGRVQDFWESLIPERKKGRVFDLLHKMDRAVAGFVRGRLTIVGILAVYMTVAYAVIGVPTWYILGPIIGLLFVAPFVHIIGVPIAMLLMWLEPSGMWADWQKHWWWIVFAPIGVYAIAQILDDYVLSPIIQGKNTDMDVGTILFASIAGGVLAGVYGLILAIPVAACIKILLVEVFWPRFRAWGQGKERDFLPIGADDNSKA